MRQNDACGLQLDTTWGYVNSPNCRAAICRRVGCDKNVQHIFFHYDIVKQTTERKVYDTRHKT
jgi:hypothetical protein